MDNKPIVGIIMGSDSDLPIMSKSVEIFKEFDIPFEVKILSAHRTPDEHSEWSKSCCLYLMDTGMG